MTYRQRKRPISERGASRHRKIATPTEHQEAVILCQWMSLRGIFYAHCPNEARRSYALARYLKAEGMTAGFPDYVILSHPQHDMMGEYDGISPPVFLELKRIGGKLSDAQSAFLERLESEGYITLVAYGSSNAIDELTKMGY